MSHLRPKNAKEYNEQDTEKNDKNLYSPIHTSIIHCKSYIREIREKKKPRECVFDYVNIIS